VCANFFGEAMLDETKYVVSDLCVYMRMVNAGYMKSVLVACFFFSFPQPLDPDQAIAVISQGYTD